MFPCVKGGGIRSPIWAITENRRNQIRVEHKHALGAGRAGLSCRLIPVDCQMVARAGCFAFSRAHVLHCRVVPPSQAPLEPQARSTRRSTSPQAPSKARWLGVRFPLPPRRRPWSLDTPFTAPTAYDRRSDAQTTSLVAVMNVCRHPCLPTATNCPGWPLFGDSKSGARALA